jgi:hypothetical protein
MTEYEVIRKRITRSRTNDPGYRSGADSEDEVFEVGDVFEPTEAELRAFSDRLREVRHREPVEDEEESDEGN